MQPFLTQYSTTSSPNAAHHNTTQHYFINQYSPSKHNTAHFITQCSTSKKKIQHYTSSPDAAIWPVVAWPLSCNLLGKQYTLRGSLKRHWLGILHRMNSICWKHALLCIACGKSQDGQSRGQHDWVHGFPVPVKSFITFVILSQISCGKV